jgi:hypothetical protein
MEHAFMKAKFLNYQKRNKIYQVEQWELYKKKQVAEII